jgi:hypothetical protein
MLTTEEDRKKVGFLRAGILPGKNNRGCGTSKLKMCTWR